MATRTVENSLQALCADRGPVRILPVGVASLVLANLVVLAVAVLLVVHNIIAPSW